MLLTDKKHPALIPKGWYHSPNRDVAIALVFEDTPETFTEEWFQSYARHLLTIYYP